jgi:hypothetical protein
VIGSGDIGLGGDVVGNLFHIFDCGSGEAKFPCHSVD